MLDLSNTRESVERSKELVKFVPHSTEFGPIYIQPLEIKPLLYDKMNRYTCSNQTVMNFRSHEF